MVVGVLVAAQSRITGQLSIKLDNGIAAALYGNLAGWALLWVLIFSLKKERSGLAAVWRKLRSGEVRLWEFGGGLCGGLFVATQATSVPTIGVAMFTIASMAGNTITSMIVDKMGISPSGKQHITVSRVGGALLTLVAVVIAVKPQLTGTEFHLVPLLFTLLAGGVVAFQQAANGQLNITTQRPLVTAWINFGVGTTVVALAQIVKTLAGGHTAPAPTAVWLYFGGFIGIIYIAFSAFVARHLSVLNFMLFGVTGNLIGALLLDWLVPTNKAPLSPWLVTGTILTLISIVGSQAFERRKLRQTEENVA